MYGNIGFSFRETVPLKPEQITEIESKLKGQTVSRPELVLLPDISLNFLLSLLN